MRIHMGDLSLQSHPTDFCRVCTEFDSRETSETAKPSMCRLHIHFVTTLWTFISIQELYPPPTSPTTPLSLFSLM